MFPSLHLKSMWFFFGLVHHVLSINLPCVFVYYAKLSKVSYAKVNTNNIGGDFGLAFEGFISMLHINFLVFAFMIFPNVTRALMDSNVLMMNFGVDLHGRKAEYPRFFPGTKWCFSSWQRSWSWT